MTFFWPMTALEHCLFVLGGLLAYLVSTRVSKQHRPPSTAVAWVMLITLLPYLGVPLFFLFGVRKVPRAPAVMSGHTPIPRDMPASWALTLMDALTMPPPTRNQSVAFHSDGQAALSAMLTMIDQAQSRIDVCTFILGNDEVGHVLSEALMRASARGVRVRVLLDAWGSWWVSKPLLRRLRRHGVIVSMFVPVWRNVRRGRSNLRNHRKLLIVDGEKVWSGGRNLSGEYFVDRREAPAWSDISFVITGSTALQAHNLFELDWSAASGVKPYADSPFLSPVPCPDAGAMVQWLPSGPDHADDTVYALLLASAYRAERRIVLISPYFVPDEALLTAWCMACRRGVKVTLVVPRRSNHRMADLARARSLRQLIDAGGSVQLFPGMLHAKAVIVDDELALCGSVNLDSRSLFLNYELNAAFYSPAEIDWLQQWARQLIQQSRAAEARASSWMRDVVEGVVRLVGFRL